jgi:hypothetical protein
MHGLASIQGFSILFRRAQTELGLLYCLLHPWIADMTYLFIPQQCKEGQDMHPDQIKAVLLDSAGFHGMM